jgi:hypothetical protein
MARKREYVRVRIETLETMIGFNLALRRDDCVNELKRLARHVGAATVRFGHFTVFLYQ